MTTFFERLQEERKRLRMNQTEFGEAAGVGKTSQINYESGKRSPDVDYMGRAAALGVDVKYVITGVRDMTDMTALEQALLTAFRGASPEIQGAALNVLLAGRVPASPAFQQDFGNATVGGIFHGDNKSDINIGGKPKKAAKK